VSVQQADEVAAAVANSAEEGGVAGDGGQQVDVCAVGQEALAHVDASELRDHVKRRIASEGPVDHAAAGGGVE
jgi:hypothetical protein